MKYELRFFFDLGSGICLWSKNDAAKEKYDYAVDHWELPISKNCKRWLDYLIKWYDVSLDWESPPEKSDIWTPEEQIRFRSAAAIGLENLVNELPSSEYVIVNEFNT